MFYTEAGRLIPHWFLLVPLAQQTLTFELTGIALLVVLMALGAYWGYNQGLRNVLTQAFWTIIAYLTTVNGGNFVIDLINRLWQNGPALFYFAIGRSPGEAPELDPLINTNIQIPLFFRVITFAVLVALGFFFAPRSEWKGNPSPKEPLARPLGLFVGAFIVLLWANAARVFWEQYVDIGGSLPQPLANVLNTLPNTTVLMPSLITIFFIMLVVLVLANFPKVWKP